MAQSNHRKQRITNKQRAAAIANLANFKDDSGKLTGTYRPHKQVPTEIKQARLEAQGMKMPNSWS